MARLETTTADPVEGAVLETECRCAADQALNRVAVVPHATLKASVARRRQDSLKKCHFHQMSAVKDILKGLMMGSDKGTSPKGRIKARTEASGTSREVREVDQTALTWTGVSERCHIIARRSADGPIAEKLNGGRRRAV